MDAKELSKRCLAITYPLLGALPAQMQMSMENRFNATVASLVSGTAELILGFSALFMLLNGVFTESFLRYPTLFGVAVLSFTAFVALEGLFRIFYIVLDKGNATGSVLYWVVCTPSHTVSSAIRWLAMRIPKPKKMTGKERIEKEKADNFKKFIEYGMDKPSLSFAR
ncbi:MAG: hypothetical protein V1836_00030 [Candidatus Aenigmatarchaeota archaeon]